MKINEAKETESILKEEFDQDYSELRSVVLYCCSLYSIADSSRGLINYIDIEKKIEELKNIVESLKKLGFSLLKILRGLGEWKIIKNILFFDEFKKLLFSSSSAQIKQITEVFIERKLKINPSDENQGFQIEDFIEKAIKLNREEIINNPSAYLHENIKIDEKIDGQILFALLVFFSESSESSAELSWTVGLKIDEKNSERICFELSKIPRHCRRELMLYFTKYRKWLVDKTLNTINESLFNSCMLYDLALGSQDSCSDYDISVTTKDESLNELSFCRKVHQVLEEILGGPVGITLDCNIYLRSFDPTTCRRDKHNSGSPVMQRMVPSPRKYFNDILIFKDNLMALLKVRKYSKFSDWENFKKKLYVSQANNETISLLLNKTDKTFQNLLRDFFKRLGIEFQPDDFPKMENIFNFLEKDFPAIFYKSCVSENLHRHEEIKSLITEYKEYRELFLTRDFQYPEADKKMDWLALKINSKKMKAFFFGVEQIFSKGCKSLVGTELAYNPIDSEIEKRRDKRKNKLCSYQALSSITECFGDFLKDLQNYQKVFPELPGQVVYMSSKYLHRMLISTKELFMNKLNRPKLQSNEETRRFLAKVETLSSQVNREFYQIRKSSSLKWFYAPNIEKSEASLKLLEEIFGLQSLELFRLYLEDFLIEINRMAYSSSLLRTKLNYIFEKISFTLKFRKEVPAPYQLLRSIPWKEKRNYKAQAAYALLSKNHRSPSQRLFWQKLLLVIFRNILSFLAAYTNFILFPLFIAYDILRFNFKHSKPGDRAYMDLRASLATWKDKQHNVIEIYQGEFLNYNISYSEAYNIDNAKLPLILRFWSEVLIIYLPFIGWILLFFNFSKLALIPADSLRTLRYIFLFNILNLFLIDLILFVLISKSNRIMLPTMRTHENLAIALKREFRKNRAKLIADIIGLLISIPMNLINNLFQQSQSDLLRILPSFGTALSLFLIKEIALKLRGKY